MATIGIMTKTIAEAVGVDEVASIMTVKALRGAGLLTTGARGIWAPKMTRLDYSRVLTALLVTESPALSVKAVRHFGKLRRSSWKPKANYSPYNFALTPEDGNTFEGALAGIIREVAALPENAIIDPDAVLVSANIGDLTCRIDTPSMTYNYASKIILDLANEKASDPKKFYALRDAYRGLRVRVNRDFNLSVLIPIAADFRNKGEETS